MFPIWLPRLQACFEKNFDMSTPISFSGKQLFSLAKS